MNKPPRCPRFSDAEEHLYERYQDFLHKFGEIKTAQELPSELKTEARNLASQLHSESYRLGTNKVFEFSDDIYWLSQCAAVVTLLAFGRNSSEYLKYEHGVLYYKNFPSTEQRVQDFESFRDHT